jgi:hypothetical protein
VKECGMIKYRGFVKEWYDLSESNEDNLVVLLGKNPNFT